MSAYQRHCLIYLFVCLEENYESFVFIEIFFLKLKTYKQKKMDYRKKNKLYWFLLGAVNILIIYYEYIRILLNISLVMMVYQINLSKVEDLRFHPIYFLNVSISLTGKHFNNPL